jgi:protein-L-isoaspartate O-methyltransferase
VDKKRSELFDEVAELYDTARPNYPAALIEDVIELANLPESATILEVGTGTGKATIPFAERGYTIHCIEPGKKLAAVAAKNLQAYPRVTIETVKFEDWTLREAEFDLIISAQAFHWVSPEIGYPKAAQALKAGGHIAVFWNFAPTPEHNEMFQALDEAYQTFAPPMVWRQQTSLESLMQKRENNLLNSQCYTDLIIKHYPWVAEYTIEQSLNLLNTQSDYRCLPESNQTDLADAIRDILEVHGGVFVKPYLSALFFAKKV